MAVNKPYYYIRLKDSFFDTGAIKILENVENGYEYIVFLLKLYLNSLEYVGKLQLNENIPYTKEMLATITGFDIELVNKAIQTLLDLELLEYTSDNVLYCTDIELPVGKSSTEADRKRLARQKIQEADKCPPELEKEKEKDIELELEIYGEYQNVYLFLKEFEELKKEYPNNYKEKIENLSDYMESSGKTYQNPFATIRLWSKNDTVENKDYSYEEGEAL